MVRQKKKGMSEVGFQMRRREGTDERNNIGMNDAWFKKDRAV